MAPVRLDTLVAGGETPHLRHSCNYTRKLSLRTAGRLKTGRHSSESGEGSRLGCAPLAASLLLSLQQCRRLTCPPYAVKEFFVARESGVARCCAPSFVGGGLLAIAEVLEAC